MNGQHVNNIFKKLPTVISEGDFECKKAIVCRDGFSVSVQASQYHYCEPRKTNAEYYSEFELGFPSEPLPELAKWAELAEDQDYTGIFGYVPVEEIAKVLESHGGVDFPAIMATK